MGIRRQHGAATIVLGIILELFLFRLATSQSFIGVNYGTIADNLPPPASTASLLMSTSIGKLRLYEPQPDLVAALAGSNISILLGIPNGAVPNLASSPAAAASWAAANIPTTVPVSAISVGNELLNSGDPTLAPQLLPAMQNLLAALPAGSTTKILHSVDSAREKRRASSLAIHARSCLPARSSSLRARSSSLRARSIRFPACPICCARQSPALCSPSRVSPFAAVAALVFPPASGRRCSQSHHPAESCAIAMSQAPRFPVRPSSMQGHDGWSLPIPPFTGEPSSIRAAGGYEEEGEISLQWLEDTSVVGQRRRVLPPAGVGRRPPSFPYSEMPSDGIPEEMPSADMHQGGGLTGLISRGIFPEASPTSAPPIQTVQANDVVPSSVRSNQRRTKNFSKDEDKLLVSAWLNVSLDPVQGVDQSRSTYWKRIYKYFHDRKTFHSERTQSSLMNRWSGIQHDCNTFAGCLSRIEARNQSGLSIDDKQANALAMFTSEDKQHRNFPYIHCWKILKDQAKWADRCKNIETHKTTNKKQKTTATSNPATSVPLLPACEENQPATCELQRPAGKKKEKEKLRHQFSIEALDYLMAKKKEADAEKELKKEERCKKAFALEEERISLEKKKFELEREMHEDTILRLDQISTVHSMAVLSASDPPSSGAFHPDLAGSLDPVLDFLHQNGAPFMINPYPYFAYASDTRPETLAFCLFQPNAGRVDAVSGLTYTNMFDAQLDAIRAALDAKGYSDVEIVIAETGWPYKGDADEAGATVDNAKAYNTNLVAHLKSQVGTPRTPGKSVDTYIFALYDEDLKGGPESERSFGLYKTDLTANYDVGLAKSSSTAAPTSLTPVPAQGTPQPSKGTMPTGFCETTAAVPGSKQGQQLPQSSSCYIPGGAVSQRADAGTWQLVLFGVLLCLVKVAGN